MTETEKILRRDVVRLETENERLKRKLQIAEALNYKAFKENDALNDYVQALEELRAVRLM